MKPPYPAFVSEWHNAPYPAIDPSSPALSHTGQTVVVTGGGSGIGQATCLAYAAAGAARLVLIGRRENKLEETKAKIKEQLPKCEVETYSASVTKAKELKDIADKVKGWDVLVLSAGRTINPKSIEESDPDGWWDVMEVRVPAPLDLSTHHH
jgi:NADP-dependent 3-hydroxy acid dehydrogenase YdfG